MRESHVVALFMVAVALAVLFASVMIGDVNACHCRVPRAEATQYVMSKTERFIDTQQGFSLTEGEQESARLTCALTRRHEDYSN